MIAVDASVIQLASSQLKTRQSYSWYHDSCRRVSHTAGIITAEDAFVHTPGIIIALEASVIQLVSSQLKTRQSYSWYHDSCRRVSHTAGIITAVDASVIQLVS